MEVCFCCLCVQRQPKRAGWTKKKEQAAKRWLEHHGSSTQKMSRLTNPLSGSRGHRWRPFETCFIVEGIKNQRCPEMFSFQLYACKYAQYKKLYKIFTGMSFIFVSVNIE